jgi:DNA-directed RNA polymerase specialized sigma24 family protein
MSQVEAGRLLGVSAATVNRRLGRGVQLLVDALGDLYPEQDDVAES